MAQAISWHSFGWIGRKASTSVHFFPEIVGSPLPVPVECRLSLFGGGLPKRTVALDGARIGEPDGIPLNELYASLFGDGSGTPAVGGELSLVGVELALSLPNAKGDLTGSQCVVEFNEEGKRSSYRPKGSSPGDQAEPPALCAPCGLVVESGECHTTLVAVNASSVPYQLQSTLIVGGTPIKLHGRPEFNIPGNDLREIVLGNLKIDEEASSTVWGRGNEERGLLMFDSALPQDISCYLIYRSKGGAESVCVL